MRACLTAIAIAFVATDSAAGVLNDFNLIVLRNVVSGTSEVEGRTIVFGDIRNSNAQNYAIFPESMSVPTTPGVNTSDTLIVGGRNFNNLNVNNGGVRIGGSGTSAPINNADYVSTNDAGVAGITAHVSQQVDAITNFFDGLTVNSSVNTSDFNKAVFNSTQGSGGISVFEVNHQFFNRNGTIDLAGDLTADLFLIKVNGASDITSGNAFNVKTAEFSNDSFQEKIVWYFPNATNLNLVNGIGGALVAPNASFRFGTPVEGSIVVKDLRLTSEVHLPTLEYEYEVIPEPGTGALCVVGAVVMINRRRRKAN